MNHLSTIVVATDFSARANRAMQRAAAGRAHVHKAALHLLYVVERGRLEAARRVIAPGHDKTEDMLFASVKSRLREFAEVLHSH